MSKIIFCDASREFTTAIQNNIQSMNIQSPFEIEYYHGNVIDMKRDNMTFVSPANSFLFFDGGIDAAYSYIFRGLQKIAQSKLNKDIPYSTILGRKYLPIGSAMVVEVENSKIIACPTMFRPQDIRGTRNVYYAILACLNVIRKYNYAVPDNMIKTIVIPGMGTGYGKLTWDDRAKQILEAFRDFLNNIEYSDKSVDPYLWLNEPNKEEQPNYYENSELKKINIQDIVNK